MLSASVASIFCVVMMLKNPLYLSRAKLTAAALERLLSGSMSSAEAAESLGVTCRQLRRLKSKYIQKGEEGLIHGNKGCKPKHSLSQQVPLSPSVKNERKPGKEYCRPCQGRAPAA
jgi:hypothetical protein